MSDDHISEQYAPGTIGAQYEANTRRLLGAVFVLAVWIVRLIGKGFAWLAAKAFKRRLYAYPGQRAQHEEALHHRRIELSLMASAEADPDQARMATEIEEGAEQRLAVLLARPLLTMAEKRERDAIQLALQQRRQSFDPIVPPLAAPQGLLGALPIPGVSWLRFLPMALVGLSIAANGVLFAAWRGAGREADQARLETREMEARAVAWERRAAAEAQARARDIASVLEETAETVEQLEARNARAARLAARERARREEANRNDPDFDLGGRLRELAEPASAADPPGGDPAGGLPGDAPGGPGLPAGPAPPA